MLLGFKTELKVNKQQRLLLAQHAGVARHAWNQGLALCQQVLIHNRTKPEDKIKFPTAIDLHKWLVAAVKSTHPWYYDVSKCAPQYALRHLSDAFKSFFKKVKGFPNFKKKGRHDSFTLDGAIHIDHKKVKVPVIGWLKTYELLPFGYKPKSITISKQADKWFISWKIAVETSSGSTSFHFLRLRSGQVAQDKSLTNPTSLTNRETPKKQEFVGVDLGINHLAV
ncbi:RNA-guided endonuclease InsQ/TnpB family protein, partial [Anabaena catenula]|uniref:RNA-guided endonuclease InsQ/TnpB family protein n=1 Tax=Anabaena catenula TaxID=1296320 RepID=UPI001F5504C0